MITPNAGAIAKTRYLLAEAMMRLLEKQGFRKISVRDICNESMVSRSAFYVHFADKYQLLEYCLDRLMEWQAEHSQIGTLEQQMLQMLDTIQTNSRVLHNVFMAEMDPEVIQLFEKLFRKMVEGWVSQMKFMSRDAKSPMPMVMAFYAGGLANVVICWIREDFATPKEELAHCQSRLMLRLLADVGEDMQGMM